MNQQYVFNNGDVIVIDHNGNQRMLDYHDKLKEVLEQENLIEVMDNKKWNLVGKQKEYESEYKSVIKEQRKGLKSLGLLSISVVIIGLLLPKFLDLAMIESIKFILPMLSFVAVGATHGLISDSKTKKYILGKKETIEKKLEKLEKQLELQKQHLEELKKDKTNTRKIEGFHVSKLNGGITLMQDNEELKDFSNLYDFIDMTVYRYHWNKADNNENNIISDDTEEKSHVLKKTL